MRLLEYDGAENISFTEDLRKEQIPPYAILSHTWGPNSDEVKLQDVIDKTAKRKPGFEKVLFCMRQARKDELQYFWIDTCCIDQTNSAELSEAINSMFHWYKEAKKCYVYLSDVSWNPTSIFDGDFNSTWVQAFQNSRWFRRGWTLQELLAPEAVEFFSKEGARFGSKTSLELIISSITGIAVKALRGSLLTTFTVQERFSWQDCRVTTKEEDKYYSLLGIMDVSMPVIYGEGGAKARQRLEKKVFDASKELTLSTGSQPENFSVTFSLVDAIEVGQFIARGEELQRMKSILAGNGSRRCVVLHGLGGIGKTQLSITYAIKYQNDYSAVFWLNIKDKDSVESSFVKAAKQILRDHPSAERLSSVDLKGDIDTIVDAVKAWLSLPKNNRWLLIFDNYDNPKVPVNGDTEAIDVRSYLPEAHHGFMIVVTRSLAVDLGHRIPIKKLESMQDSLSILKSTSQRQDLMNDANVERLAQKLDGLPLALATAGAYLHSTPAVSCMDYLQRYEHSWAKLQKLSPRISSYDRTLYSTWQISFDQVAKQSSPAANLLRLRAYFDNQDIWFEMLRNAAREDSPTWLQELVLDELDFDKHLRVLCDHGLVEKEVGIEPGPESYGYSIHACLHSWIQTVLNSSRDGRLERIALYCVARHIQDIRALHGWMIDWRLLKHATVCTRAFRDGLMREHGMEWANSKIGSLYFRRGRLNEAEQMFERALQGWEIAFGEDHPSTLDAVNNLGAVYLDQGRLEKAKQMLERALCGMEKAFGKDHPLTLNAVDILGVVYINQGRFSEGEQMLERALQGKEKALGAAHPSTLDTVNSLGIAYVNQGRVNEAKQMVERALLGMNEVYGNDHPSMLNTVNSLGIVHLYRSRLDSAEQILERALQGREKTLGEDHSSTLATVYSLGAVYLKQGRLDKAEQMLERALRGKEKALGEDHPSTLAKSRHLVSVYSNQGWSLQAERMLERALQGKEQALREDHPLMLNIFHSLGIVYVNQDRLDEAEMMFERALRGKENIFGMDHRLTLGTIQSLVLVYLEQGKHSEAKQMFGRVLRSYQSQLHAFKEQITALEKELSALQNKCHHMQSAPANDTSSPVEPVPEVP